MLRTWVVAAAILASRDAPAAASPNHAGDGNFAMALAPTGELYVVGRTSGAEPASWLRKYAP